MVYTKTSNSNKTCKNLRSHSVCLLTSTTMKVLILVLVFITAASAVVIRQCRSTGNVDVSKISITGCTPHRRECIFKKGQNANMTLPFTPKYPAQNLTAVVHGIIYKIPIPFPLPNDHACVNSGLHCPLQPNIEVVYTAALPVKKQYPSIRLTVQWEIKDERGLDVICIKFPVKLQG